MSPLKKILVPLDGSDLAERALGPAFTLAQQAKAALMTLSVPVIDPILVAEPVGYGLLSTEEHLKQEYERLVEYGRTIQERGQKHHLTVTTKVTQGEVASTIIHTAVTQKIDLIVMSTHGYSGLTRWVLGSITERVLRHAPCPVLVVRANKPISRTLITLDGSALSERALEPGLAIARLFASEVALLRVCERSEINHKEVAQLDWVEPGLGQRVAEGFYNHEEEYLKQIAQEQERAGQEIKTLVGHGPVAHSILNFADMWRADLIVMSTHGRSGLQRWAYGSITEKVLHSTRTAMLIVRSPQLDEELG